MIQYISLNCDRFYPGSLELSNDCTGRNHVANLGDVFSTFLHHLNGTCGFSAMGILVTTVYFAASEANPSAGATDLGAGILPPYVSA